MSEYEKIYGKKPKPKTNYVTKFFLHSVAFIIGCFLLYIGLWSSYEVSIEKHAGYNPNIILEAVLGDIFIIISSVTGVFLILVSTNTLDIVDEILSEFVQFITKNW